MHGFPCYLRRAESACAEDPAKRKALVEEIQRLAYDDVP
jgi:hypothetical protein